MLDERVAQLIRQGQSAAQSGNNERAREYLQAAVDLAPNSATAWLWLAGVLSEPAEAKYALERVLELEPGNTRAQQGLAHMEQRLAQQPAAPSRVSFEETPRTVVRGTGQIGATTGPLTIEQELRSQLRGPSPTVSTSAEFDSLRGSPVAALSDGSAVPARGRRVAVFGGGSDMVYRVSVIALTLFLLLGFVLFLIVLF